jgi:hypothetical protein
MDNLQENLKEIYRSLPLHIRETIFAPETTDAYDRVQKRYGFTKEQREILSVQCGLLMMGLILPQDLVPVLSKELNLSQQKASLVAQDINREVFNMIKNELKEIHAISSNANDVIGPKTDAAAPEAVSIAPPKTPGEVLPSSTAPSSVPPPSTPALSAPSQSIFEQKLGGAFRMKSDTTDHGMNSVISTPNTPPATPLATPKVDPYREAA